MAERHLAKHPGERVLVLAHTDELVLQAADKMRKTAPHRTVGIVKASQNEVHAQVIVASVQSLRSKARRDKIRNVGLVIVDECHHGTAATYRTILEHFGCFGSTRAAGFTATLVRGDKAKLSDIWQDVVFRKDIAFMIRRGYLLDVKGKRVEVPDFDLRNVRVSGGDYQDGALGDALIEAFAPEIVAGAYVEHASDRQGLVFAPTVASAYAFADAFNDAGIKTEVVHGGLARDERRAILARLADGTTQCVSNCMVLTEGFDNPKVSCAVIARPTKSAGLYQQMVGRVLRPDLTLPVAERGHALILDVVGVSRTHDLRSLVDLSTRRDLPEDLDEDLTLLELEDLLIEEEEEIGFGGQEEDAYYAGPVETREFDPLGRDSKRTWSRTPAGTYYMPAGGDHYVFLTESLTGDPGTFDVVWCTKRPGGAGTAGLTEHRAMGFEMAISWGEEEATERGGHGTKSLTTKTSKWRNEAATSAQLYRLHGLGIRDVGQITKGEASALIEDVMAARRIDPLVRAVKGKVGK
jgi:superfamily II DNA or RNA helicase